MQQILRTDFLQSLIAAPIATLMLCSVAFNCDEILYLINTNHTVENKILDWYCYVLVPFLPIGAALDSWFSDLLE